MTQQSHYWAYTLRKTQFKDTCTPVITAALFITARTWKKPRCPSKDEWIKKLWYKKKKKEVVVHIYNGILLNQKNEHI